MIYFAFRPCWLVTCKYVCKYMHHMHITLKGIPQSWGTIIHWPALRRISLSSVLTFNWPLKVHSVNHTQSAKAMVDCSGVCKIFRRIVSNVFFSIIVTYLAGFPFFLENVSCVLFLYFCFFSFASRLKGVRGLNWNVFLPLVVWGVTS